MITRLLVIGDNLYNGLKRKFRRKRLVEYISPPKADTAAHQAGHLLGGTYRQTMAEFSSEEDKKRIKDKHQQMNRIIAVTAVSLVLTTLGTWVYWPMNLLAIPGIFYSTQLNNQRTYQALKEKRVVTDTLVTITTIGAVVTGYFFIAALNAFLFRLSNKLVLMTTDDSRQRLVDVFRQTPHFVWLVVQGVELKIPFAQLQVGDVIVIHAGELIPADGTVVAGMATVDQHILTGESKSVEKESGDTVFASTLMISGEVHIRVEKTGQATAVAKIGHILNETIDFKSTQQLRAEQLADRTVMPTLVIGALSLLFVAPTCSLSFISSHFKNRMSIIAPIGILNYFNLASQAGILIKDGRSLDLLNKVDTLVFDKTGTLTIEQPHIKTIHVYASYNEDEILCYAAAAEYKQTHPIAKAIMAEAEKRQLDIPTIKAADYKIGYGLTVKLGADTIRVGSYRFMESAEIPLSVASQQIQAECHALGHSLIMVAFNQQLVGALELVPTVRPEAKAILQQLRQQGRIKEIYIISGDHELPTRKLAEVLEVDHYFAETLPENKAALIDQLRQQGRFVCYVGDGINDSIALKKSHVSISLRGASTVATDTAQIILIDEGLSHLPYLFDLAKAYNRNMETSFFIVMIPTVIAMGGALFFGFGLATSMVFNLVSLAIGVGNAMLPLVDSVTNNNTTNNRRLEGV